MKSSSARVGIAVAVAVAIAAGETDARAIEGQHHIGVAPAFGVLTISGKSTADVGFGGAAHYTYGLSDQWNLAIEGSSLLVAADQMQDSMTSPHNRPSMAHQASAGVSYVVDIIQLVPYLTLQGGTVVLTGGTLDRALVLPALTVGVGFDYQLSRQLAIGLAGREHMMLTKLDTYSSYTTVLLRFEYMWGY